MTVLTRDTFGRTLPTMTRPRLPDSVRALCGDRSWPADPALRRAYYAGTIHAPDVRRDLLAWVHEVAARGPGGEHPTAASIGALLGITAAAVRKARHASGRDGGPWPVAPLDPGARPRLDVVTAEGERARGRRARAKAAAGL